MTGYAAELGVPEVGIRSVGPFPQAVAAGGVISVQVPSTGQDGVTIPRISPTPPGDGLRDTSSVSTVAGALNLGTAATPAASDFATPAQLGTSVAGLVAKPSDSTPGYVATVGSDGSSIVYVAASGGSSSGGYDGGDLSSTSAPSSPGYNGGTL